MEKKQRKKPIRTEPKAVNPALMGELSGDALSQSGQLPQMPQTEMDEGTGLPTEQRLQMPVQRKAPVIGPEEVKIAFRICQDYKKGKQNLEQRIIENEKWYRLHQWDAIGAKQAPDDPLPTSAWLFNSLANKHADAMDQTPTLIALPQESRDKQDAETLSDILPVVLEQSDFQKVYYDLWWYKLRTGTGVYGVSWDNSMHNGAGDISINSLDLLNLFWEPGCNDIQKSRNFFHVELVDKDTLKEQFPEQLDGVVLGDGNVNGTIAEYAYDDSIDLTDKALVVDWYYKKMVGTKTVVHYCKFVDDIVLYASENSEEYAESGYYDHGEYPFVFDVLFPIDGSPAGFGYVDLCKSPQIYIDKLDQSLLKNAIAGSRPRWWVRDDGSVNEEEYADHTKSFIHYSGMVNPKESIFPVDVPTIPPHVMTVREAKIDELKETSGNRDFSQGSAAAGVTAASAIAALQEAGSKLSRDMIKGSYWAFRELGYLCIELIRQFYDTPREFRITGKNGGMQFTEFSNQNLKPVNMVDNFMESVRMPVFDIKVVAQKANPFSVEVQNERAKELYGMGFFRPDMADQSMVALEMMQFEGIDQLKERISQNGTLYQKIQQITPLTVMLAQQVDMMTGSNFAPQVSQILGIPVGTPQQGGTGGAMNLMNNPINAKASEFRKNAAQQATPR